MWKRRSRKKFLRLRKSRQSSRVNKLREQFWRRIPVPKTILFYLEYLIIRAILCLLLALPKQFARTLLVSLTRSLSFFDKRHVNVTTENLHFAGININPNSVFRHFGETVFHMAQSVRLMRRSSFRRYFTFENETILKEAINSGRGTILVSGHLGNWEMGIAALALAGYPINCVVFKQINPYLDNLINRYRTGCGIKIMYSRGAINRCVEALNKREIVLMLIDQTGRDEGVMADFFGRQAPAMWGPANLMIKTSASIIPFACVSRRPGELDYLITFLPKIEYKQTGDKNRDIQCITQLYIKGIELLIRKYPEQWIWFHRRWKQYQTNRK
ncbi:MAG: lysophospholipid acyltransferase family protein [Planctomycetota bacterium]